MEFNNVKFVKQINLYQMKGRTIFALVYVQVATMQIYLLEYVRNVIV